MKVTRQNIPRPIITTSQKNRIDYVFIIILLLYLFIFPATVQCKAVEAREATSSVRGVVSLVHASIGKFGHD